MRFIGLKNKDVGLPPGTLLMPEVNLEKDFKFSVLNYNSREFREELPGGIDEALAMIDDSAVSWLDIESLNDLNLLTRLGEKLNVHSLTLEDILSSNQRQKIEDHGDFIFVVVNSYTYTNGMDTPQMEQLHFLLGANYLISFREHNSELLAPLKNRIREGKGVIREKGADYLLYAILDFLVDRYFLLLERVNTKIVELENALKDGRQSDVLDRIYILKNELMAIQRSALPLRQLVAKYVTLESGLINGENSLYFNDISDHITTIVEEIQLMREVVDNIFYIYQSVLTFRMNDVMKILTIIGTIFIPITFIAGIYGMNFEVMPELKSEYGYPLVMGLMALITVIMLIFFKRRRWF